MPEFDQTHLHPIALILTLTMGVFLLRARRSTAVLGFLAVACLIPELQRIVVLGQDFTMIRLLLVFGLVKIATSRDTARLRIQKLDLVFVAWLVSSALIYTAREASLAALSNRLGHVLEALGVYFVFRILLCDASDVRRAVRLFAWIAVPMGVLMVVENQTGRNLFSPLGGVPELTMVRDGRLRAQGAFSHAILAGSFGASLMPMFVALALGAPRGRRTLAYAAAGASVLIALLSASSGPLVALGFGIVAWVLWPFRGSLSLVRWGSVAALVTAHFIREQPVWQLIGRLSSFTGGTGYHRSKLIDAFIHRFDEWWLLGTSTTRHWFIGESEDLTNQFVAEGVRGGIVQLALFVLLLGMAFSALGRARVMATRTEKLRRPARRAFAYLAWGLGASLAVHCVSFISVAYFGQMQSIFYLHLAMIASFCASPEFAAAGSRLAITPPSRKASPVPGVGSYT